MNHEAFNALCYVDPKKSTGADQLRAMAIIITSSNELNNYCSISKLSQFCNSFRLKWSVERGNAGEESDCTHYYTAIGEKTLLILVL